MSQTELKPVLSSSPNNSTSHSSANKRQTLQDRIGRGGAGVCSEFTELAVSAAIDQKALDVKALDVSQQCSFADNFLIVSGTSERHARGIADKIISRLKEAGAHPLSTNGLDRGEWIVLDFDDLIVHVFFEPSRQFYELDAVWEDAPLVPLPPELQEEIRFLRTGSFR